PARYAQPTRTIAPLCPGRLPFPGTPRLAGFLVTPLNLRLSESRIGVAEAPIPHRRQASGPAGNAFPGGGALMSRSGCLALLTVLASWTTATAQSPSAPAAPGGPGAGLGAPVVSGPTACPAEVQGGDAACAQEPCVGGHGPCPPAGRFWASG